MIARSGMVYAFFIFVFMLLIADVVAQSKANHGLLDARRWNFTENRLPLTGQWVFFDRALVNPDSCAHKKGTYSFFPSLWNEDRRDGTGIGYATYYLKVLVPDSIKNFSIEMPQLFNSCKLWVNGKLLVTVGTVATSKEKTTPQWINKIASFENQRDTLRFVLQLANFHHHKGGMKDPIYLGTPVRIDQHRLWAWGSNLAEIIFLFLEGIVFTILYLRQKNKVVVLCFAMLCLTWCVRALCSNLYPLVSFVPGFNWNMLVKIEYLTLYGGVIWSIVFLNFLFKNISKPIIAYLLAGINVFFALFTLFTPPLVFTRWINVYLTVAGIAVAYGGIIIIQALLYEQIGAWFLLFSILLGVVVFGYDIAAYESAAGHNLIVLNMGYMIIFILITIGLLLHLGILKTNFGHSEILTYNDMFGKDSTTKKKK